MTIGTIGPNLAQTLTATTLPTVQRALSQALETLPAGTAPDRTQAAAFVQTIVQSLDASLGDAARTPEQVRDAALAAARSALSGPTVPPSTSLRDAGVLVDAVIRALEARGGGTAARARPGAEPTPPPPLEAPNPVRAPPALVAAVVETLQLTNTGSDADPAVTAIQALQTPAVLATQAAAVSLATRNGDAPVTAAFVDNNPVPAPVSASAASTRIASSPNPAPTQNASAVAASARDAAVLVEAILQALETSGVAAGSSRRGETAAGTNHTPPALNSVGVQTALQSFVQAYFSSSRPLRRKPVAGTTVDDEDEAAELAGDEEAAPAPAPEPAHAAAAAYAQVGADGGGRLQRFGDRLSQHAGLGALKKAFDGLVAAFIGPETPAPVSLEAFLRNLEQALGAAGPAQPDGRFVRTRA